MSSSTQNIVASCGYQHFKRKSENLLQPSNKEFKKIKIGFNISSVGTTWQQSNAVTESEQGPLF